MLRTCPLLLAYPLQNVGETSVSNEIDRWKNQLEQNDPTLQAEAAEHLAQAGPAAVNAAVALVRAVGSPNESVCEWATSALEGIECPLDEQLPELVMIAQSSSGDTCYWAITLIGCAESKAASATPQLTTLLLESPELNIQQRAAWALKKIGPGAADASQALQAAAQSDDARLARLATQALEAIGI